MFDRELIEAKLALDLIHPEDMPAVAWDALEAGLDGPGIARMAALERPTFFEVAHVLPKAKLEMALVDLSPGEAALRIARRWATAILASKEDPLPRTRQFEYLCIKAGYPREIESVGTLYDDVSIAEFTGQPKTEIRSWLVERLREFIA